MQESPVTGTSGGEAVRVIRINPIVSPASVLAANERGMRRRKAKENVAREIGEIGVRVVFPAIKIRL